MEGGVKQSDNVNPCALRRELYCPYLGQPVRGVRPVRAFREKGPRKMPRLVAHSLASRREGEDNFMPPRNVAFYEPFATSTGADWSVLVGSGAFQ